MRKLLALAAAILLTANGEPATLNPGIALGETAELGHDIRVTPLVVEEDSRCPIGTSCFWEGRLVLRTVVERGKQSQEHLLLLNAPERVFGGMLTLGSAEPAPKANSPTLPGPYYRFTFSYAHDLAG